MVTTNDPHNPSLRLILSGRVEKFASIEPGLVYFRGEAEKVEAIDLEVTPNSSAGFRIVKVVTDKPHLFTAELVEPCQGKKATCRIRVRNMQKNAGKYVGMLYVTTDSSLKSSFPVVVRANLR